jgi:hypothetical protein
MLAAFLRDAVCTRFGDWTLQYAYVAVRSTLASRLALRLLPDAGAHCGASAGSAANQGPRELVPAKVFRGRRARLEPGPLCALAAAHARPARGAQAQRCRTSMSVAGASGGGTRRALLWTAQAPGGSLPWTARRGLRCGRRWSWRRRSAATRCRCAMRTSTWASAPRCASTAAWSTVCLVRPRRQGRRLHGAWASAPLLHVRSAPRRACRAATRMTRLANLY